MICSKERSPFGPIFDQALLALINILDPQCTLSYKEVGWKE